MAVNRETFQSETGRGIDSLVSSSPLFYTVSGSQGEKQSQPRYYEQLGCPSILKPSFRDLPGCTRLSVGVPSTSYRSFPLDKLNKTMGKSPTSQSKRNNRGEKYIPPIKVNAKIRHIYSHIASSQSSQQSSITNTSTQTDFNEIVSNDPFDSLSEERVVDESILSRKDASTCMSPPPPTFQQSASTPTLGPVLFSVPPPYAGKLEDLEKITGHIVIQRFFTRADDIFGSWVEKQLGMNNKSVGVGTSEVMTDTGSTLPNPDCETEICSTEDAIRCECFGDYYKTEETYPVLKPKESTTNENTSLTQLEHELISQAIEYEVNVPLLSTESNIKGDDAEEFVPSSTEVMTASNVETDAKGLSETVEEVLNKVEEAELTSQTCDEELDIRLKSLDLEWVNEEIVEDQAVLSSNTVIKLENDDQELADDVFAVDNQPSLIQNASEEQDRGSQGELEIEDASPEQIQTLLTEAFPFPSAKCIPDVIDASDLVRLETFYKEQSSEPIEEDDDLRRLIKADSSNQMESQSKVEEYLAELERRTSTSVASEVDEKIAYDGIDQGESSAGGNRLKDGDEIKSGPEKGNYLKRSVSIDSCIGTESSGEARHGMNESFTPIDSGRIVQDEMGQEVQGSSGNVLETANLQGISKLENKDSWDTQDSQDQEVVTILSSKSMNESNSRSELSSAIKQGSDGEDADQSESESEISSLKRPTGSVMSAVVEELNREDIEQALLVHDDEVDDNQIDEIDQFDAMIENHEKEKRLRPVCRKRNATTQTTKSVESSILSASTTSRSTTATSDSSFDLEFVSKSKKVLSQLSTGNNSSVGDKRRSYLPSGSSSLNVLNMKFTMGNEFESEVSIRIPPKSPAGLNSSPMGVALPGLTGVATVGASSGRNEKDKRLQGRLGQDSELKNLWKDVKSRMDSRVIVSESRSSLPSAEMHVRGNRLKLISGVSGDAEPAEASNFIRRIDMNEGVEFTTNEEERIKRSLKRLKKILDD